MFYINLSNQLTYLIYICFSFFIFIFNICMNKEKTYIKLFGLTFIIPLALSIASFFSVKEMYSKPLIFTAQIIILLSLSLILKFKPGINKFNQLTTTIFITPIILIILLLKFEIIRKYAALAQVHTPAIILLGSVCIILLMNKKNSQNILIWAIFSEIFSNIIKLFKPSDIFSLSPTLLEFLFFTLLLVYFYKEINTSLLKIVDEAEKKLIAVNKTLDLEVKKRVFEIELSNERLVTISKTDSLTKAFNKAAILDKIDSLANDRKSKEFCILMFDIDSFKSINDTLGHIRGDKCLKKLSLLARESIRDIDSLGRYGGDEFIIVLPNVSVSHAKIVAERFRKNVLATETPHFTISIGIAAFPQDGTTVKELIAVADEGLYMSKKKGKNAVSYRGVF